MGIISPRKISDVENFATLANFTLPHAHTAQPTPLDFARGKFRRLNKCPRSIFNKVYMWAVHVLMWQVARQGGLNAYSGGAWGSA